MAVRPHRYCMDCGVRTLAPIRSRCEDCWTRREEELERSKRVYGYLNAGFVYTEFDEAGLAGDVARQVARGRGWREC